jgi:hypothetical protein
VGAHPDRRRPLCPYQPAHCPHHLPTCHRGLVPRCSYAVPARQPPQAAPGRRCPPGLRYDPRPVTREGVNNAHIDTLGVLFVVLALGTVTAGARRGMLLGAAIAVKLLPVLALPAHCPGNAARPASCASSRPPSPPSRSPTCPTSRPPVRTCWAYLPGYLHDEGYEPGHVRRFALLRLLLPDAAAGVTAAVLLALIGLYVWWRGDPARPWRGALLQTGTALLLFSPSYPWYSLLVVALVAMDGRWEWLTVTLSGTTLYLAGRLLPGFPLQTWAYGTAAIVIAACAPVGHARSCSATASTGRRAKRGIEGAAESGTLLRERQDPPESGVVPGER